MTMNEIAADIHFTSISKGFESPNEENINRKLLLAVSEICEAQGELRDGHGLNEIYYSIVNYHKREFVDVSVQLHKPEGFPIEIADAIIRLFHICHAVGIDIDKTIQLKIDFNKKRPDKHGRRF